MLITIDLTEEDLDLFWKINGYLKRLKQIDPVGWKLWANFILKLSQASDKVE